MTNYGYADLEGLWINAGGPAQVASVAAAVALAESTGNSQAYNSSGATGLWQILGSECGGPSFDPATNAREAVCKYQNAGNSFKPWVQYTNGAYVEFMQPNVTPNTNVPGNATAAATNPNPGTTTTGNNNTNQNTAYPGGPSCSGGILGAVFSLFVTGSPGCIMDLVVQTIIDPLLEIIAGVLGIMGGSALMAGGIWMIISESETGQKAEQGAVRLGATVLAPEAASQTIHTSSATSRQGEPLRARVTQYRRPSLRLAGVEFRPARQRTESVQEVLRNEAWVPYTSDRTRGPRSGPGGTGAGSGANRPAVGGQRTRGRAPGTYGGGVGGGKPPSGTRPPRTRSNAPRGSSSHKRP